VSNDLYNLNIENSVILAQNGDEEGFEALWNHFAPRIHSYILSRVQSHAEADDLLSEVFIRLFSKITTYDPKKAAFSTWLFTVTRNILSDYYGSNDKKIQWTDPDKLIELERQGKTTYIYELYQQTAEEIDKNSLTYESKLESIRKVLEQLPPQYAELIRLKYFLGLDASQIAKQQSKTQGNIRVALHRALARAEELIRKLNL
jgi:RNA polymerase sigma-70 factor (ECF subfamily)